MRTLTSLLIFCLSCGKGSDQHQSSIELILPMTSQYIDGYVLTRYEIPLSGMSSDIIRSSHFTVQTAIAENCKLTIVYGFEELSLHAVNLPMNDLAPGAYLSAFSITPFNTDCFPKAPLLLISEFSYP